METVSVFEGPTFLWSEEVSWGIEVLIQAELDGAERRFFRVVFIENLEPLAYGTVFTDDLDGTIAGLAAARAVARLAHGIGSES